MRTRQEVVRLQIEESTGLAPMRRRHLNKWAFLRSLVTISLAGCVWKGIQIVSHSIWVGKCALEWARNWLDGKVRGILGFHGLGGKMIFKGEGQSTCAKSAKQTPLWRHLRWEVAHSKGVKGWKIKSPRKSKQILTSSHIGSTEMMRANFFELMDWG
jgi:hypothetical protein